VVLSLLAKQEMYVALVRKRPQPWLDGSWGLGPATSVTAWRSELQAAPSEAATGTGTGYRFSTEHWVTGRRGGELMQPSVWEGPRTKSGPVMRYSAVVSMYTANMRRVSCDSHNEQSSFSNAVP
jgi:hypothetical protein